MLNQSLPLVICFSQSPRNRETTGVPHQVGSVYKRTEGYKLGCQGPGRLHVPPYQDGLALDPCLDLKHHGKEQQKQAQLEGTIY